MSDVSLSIRAGQIVGLLGPNGSGKTTLLRVLATLEAPNAGIVEWFGIRDRRSPAVRRRLGVAFDQPVHFDGLTGWQNASYFASLYALRRRRRGERLAELFHWAGIEDAAQLPVREYSLGMRRRLSLVEALCHEPALVLLDEPTLALDEGGELDLVTRLRQLTIAGAGVLVATNDRALARSLCDTAVDLVPAARAAPSTGSPEPEAPGGDRSPRDRQVAAS